MTQSQATSDQQTWRVLAHASAFIQLVGIPSIVGPLIVWLIRRDDPVVEPHARAALNFQLSVLIYFVVGGVAAFALFVTIVGIVASVLIVLLLIVLGLLELVFALLATIDASKGVLYQYPLNLNLIK
jgi:uncharacterized protein